MTELRALAYVSWGRWVADCPRPGCTNAEHFGRDKNTGHVGGLTGVTFVCGTAGNGCGLRCRADWPQNVADIERLLMMRPVVATRNWHPGEDLHGLAAENLQHGAIAGLDELEGGVMLRIEGDRITADQLPSGQPALGAGE